MKTHHLVILAGIALLGFTGYALTGAGAQPVPAAVAAKGDRLDVMERLQRCTGTSIMAACADDGDADRAFARDAAFVQTFEKSGETILVRSKIGS